MKTSTQAISVAHHAEAGIVDNEALEQATEAASKAKEVLMGMHLACAVSCAKGCRGCRVARLLNQTLALQQGVDDAVEVGYFVDDERTMTSLPARLMAQAGMAKSIASSLRILGSRCPQDHDSSRGGGGGREGRNIGRRSHNAARARDDGFNNM